MTTDDYVEPDIMTWFPRREDYEDKPEIKPDENYEDKLQRLLETIEAAQNSIKEVVDGNTCTLEHKVYRVMDVNQDIDDILKLQKECEGDAGASNCQDTLKKARIGLQNLKVYINQVSKSIIPKVLPTTDFFRELFLDCEFFRSSIFFLSPKDF